jgi:hypothetical protein
VIYSGELCDGAKRVHLIHGQDNQSMAADENLTGGKGGLYRRANERCQWKARRISICLNWGQNA